jgi:hypothetical protein
VKAGGVFLRGGYNFVVRAASASALAARRAWSGDFVEYKDVLVELPPAADGATVQLRWRMATDDNGGDRGYWIDNIHVELDRAARDEIFSDAFEPN